MAKRTSKMSNKTSKLRKQIEATFEKTLERTVERAMHLPQVERAVTQAMRTANHAKETLDQALLDLQHKAVDLKAQPQDLIQKVGQRVLERAERIRAQVAETPYSPSWLRDLSLAPRIVESGEADESLEDSDEERAAGAIVETKRGKVTLATTVAATESEAAADMQPESFQTATKAGKPAKMKRETATTKPKSSKKGGRQTEKSIH
ncbi:MAG: hypothetical protein V4760_08150 [Bdellovibrionota bacterium]